MEISIKVDFDQTPEELAVTLAGALLERLPGLSADRDAQKRRVNAATNRSGLPGRLASVRQDEAGVSFQTEAGVPGRLPHAFIVESRGQGVFMRRTRHDSLPIDKIYRRLPGGAYAITKAGRRLEVRA